MLKTKESLNFSKISYEEGKINNEENINERNKFTLIRRKSCECSDCGIYSKKFYKLSINVIQNQIKEKIESVEIKPIKQNSFTNFLKNSISKRSIKLKKKKNFRILILFKKNFFQNLKFS